MAKVDRKNIMSKQQIKNLDLMIQEVDKCNNYFTNHVGSHDNDYIRKVFIIVAVIVSMAIILV